ncbi:ectoine/hydroxyectoine ABC transporter substrate-binding protein EhuB [Desulfolutivibrio sulfoxidireducens]|uniref:ectoine/hydroxyectoine ABC transporter substrate-binding protein EhuB n=1 Tax=Desulfolutivibrio sulfoxidireducens TaxID=2773299 RepID=UPI00159DF835|nr:ectoine/hydroxyectoine ABC transporter substrate-binding protein EhuB [Desulfolutivibrio sulfoxidireducens]QLA18993.1 ectoine/hydroxyectoine ABC transporter substrate-binding protein EhuB [Desulfolutivibrio sulfoxidireducens]
MNRILPASVAAVAVIGLLVALAAIFLDRERPEIVWSGKTLRVGYAEEYPYAFRDATGRVTGESPETARVVLKRLGIGDVRFVLSDFANLIRELERGEIDMIAAGMFITPERSRRIVFSLPTARVGQGLLVRQGNPKDLHSYTEMAARPDVTPAVLAGSVEEEYLKALGVPDVRLFRVPDAATGAAAVKAGRADGLALSAPSVNLLAEDSNGALAAAAPFAGSVEDGGELASSPAFGFRKADEDLRQAVDVVLRGFVGSPEHLALVAPFGFTAGDMPKKTTP